MGKFISKLIFKIFGWHLNKASIPPEAQRCVMIASPHTSNWDFVFAKAAFVIMEIPLRFTIKKEWIKPPFGGLMIKMGGIGIDRSPRRPGEKRPSMVESMVRLFEEHKALAIMVTPEGTRSLRTEWKTGFYYVALKAGVPICLGYLDYRKKEAGVGKVVFPTGNVEEDMQAIMEFYAPIHGKHPKNFSVDLRYHPKKDD